MNPSQLNHQLKCLVIFREARNDSVIQSFETFLDSLQTQQNVEENYASFIYYLYQNGGDLGNHLSQLVLNMETLYLQKASSRNNPHIQQCHQHELSFFEKWSQLSHSIIMEWVTPFSSSLGSLPSFENTAHSLQNLYHEKLAHLSTRGYGVFSQYTMFQFTENGLKPVRNPDPQTLSSLVGYERERKLLLTNTRAFLDGKTASNALLYGDAGTGKSSTIKALANEYQSQGLRLIELKKKQLHELPGLTEQLAENPLKFVLFIDDLTFSQPDENFGALKSVLEGGAAAQGKNILIYATSNRRHLVRESMEQRFGTELHENDTIQETIGLAGRFGLTITYQRPDRKTYLEIVAHYAEEYGLDMDPKQQETRAEAYALRNGGRSPRAAKQFVQLEKGLS